MPQVSLPSPLDPSLVDVAKFITLDASQGLALLLAPIFFSMKISFPLIWLKPLQSHFLCSFRVDGGNGQARMSHG